MPNKGVNIPLKKVFPRILEFFNQLILKMQIGKELSKYYYCKIKICKILINETDCER